ncbi:hypothetical protein ACQJBY_017770 [Aegilops geniculata]
MIQIIEHCVSFFHLFIVQFSVFLVVTMMQSNVRRERPKRPDPPCTICKGTGTINCRNCFGRGRINHVDLAVLPKGEWPQWCQICGGSGLDYCQRCHGTGEYREPMGFHFTVNRK